ATGDAVAAPAAAGCTVAPVATDGPAGALVSARATTGAGSTCGAGGTAAERAANGSRSSTAQVPTATSAARPAMPPAMTAGRFHACAAGTAGAGVTSPQSPLSISLIQGRRAGSFS